MRLSCITSKFVCVVLETSMYFSWIGKEWFFSRRVKFDSGFNVMAVYEVSWHGPEVIYRFTGIRKRVVRWWKRPFWLSKKISLTFSSNCLMPYQGGCSQFLISSNKCYSSICDWKNEFSIFFGKYYFLCIESFWSRFPMRPSSPTPQGLRPLRHPSKFTPRTERIQGTIQVRLSFQIDGFLTGPSQFCVILNQFTKRNDRSFTSFSKTSLVWSFLIRQEILNAQIKRAIHGIRPPFFVQTWLQQYRRCSFLNSAYCSLSNPICFRSVWCWRTMIPGKIFTSFAKFQGIVGVNDFRLPIRLQELLQAPLCFLWSFCFARIRLDSLGSQVLHHDCISMIVSRFTSFTDNLVICFNQITKIFCTRYDSANTSSARGPCDFGPLADLAISVFREVSMNTVFTQIHTSRRLWR